MQSTVPITLIPLDATNYTPVRTSFIEKLKAENFLATRLVVESLSIIQASIDNGTYLFWDTLTSAALLSPAGVVETREVRINVRPAAQPLGEHLKTQKVIW